MQQTQQIKRTKTAEQALNALMRLCARAERSSGDAMRLMLSWGVPQADREGVLSRLLKDKFIDDSRYAEAFVREKVNLSAWGEYKIRTALRRKGIDDATIARAMQAMPAEQSAHRLAERLERKLKSLKYDSVYQLKTKLIRHGLSLGYAMDEVMSCVDEITEKLNKQCDEDTIFF